MSNITSAQNKLRETTLVVIFIFLIFFSVFVALKLNDFVAPDEPAHVRFSKYYSTTIGIPPDTEETLKTGWYIQHNPFLYYWINGRVLNLVNLVAPNTNERVQLVILRLVNVLYSVGTVWFCYRLAKEVLGDTWWALLPPFLLMSTLMFTFLSGAVSYDNLANLFSFISIYYLVRLIKGYDFLRNTLKSFTAVLFGCLVKYPIVPLALFIFFAWLIFVLKNKEKIKKEWKTGSQVSFFTYVAFAIAFFGFLAVFGYNILVYRAITPQCTQIFSNVQCNLSPYAQRVHEMALPHKLSIWQAMMQGYPDPITYVIDEWFPLMIKRIYGVFGHLVYSPTHTVIFLRVWWLAAFLLIFQGWKQVNKLIYYLVGIVLAYIIIIMMMSYESELTYGFKYVNIQGRYVFPTIGVAYVLAIYGIQQIKAKWLRLIAVCSTIILFVVAGPIKFLLQRNTIFLDWFLH